MGILNITDHTGHDERAWRQDDAASVLTCEQLFKEKLGQGYVAARAIPGKENSSEQIRAFDPEAESIVMHRPLVGG